jgi:phosphoglycerate dehydrogenase-like enzyme
MGRLCPVTSAPRSADRVTAGVTGVALEIVRRSAPWGVDIVALENGVNPEAIDFLVPPSDGSGRVLEVLPDLHRLSVVQVLSAGTDWIEDRLPPQATLCSARGARDGPVSEWILGALLGATTGLLECARIHHWTDRRLTDLSGWTVLIVGMGSIGQMVRTRLEILGTTVVGVASRPRNGLRSVDELAELLPGADAVVVLTPLTEATRGLIGVAELAAMRDGALLVNAARGPVIDTDALLSHVADGRLRAVLDVTDPEPLPDGHPLWTAPGVLSITPHIAGDSPRGWAHAAALAGDQLVRWRTGEPLRNIVRIGTG